MKPAHTPLPWRLGRNGADCLIFKGEHKFVADCDSADEDSDGTDEDRANAAFIVRAVNSHAALVATLENILEFMEDKFHEFDGADCDPDDGKLCPKCESNGCIEMKFKQIRAALKLAESDQ